MTYENKARKFGIARPVVPGKDATCLSLSWEAEMCLKWVHSRDGCKVEGNILPRGRHAALAESWWHLQGCLSTSEMGLSWGQGFKVL